MKLLVVIRANAEEDDNAMKQSHILWSLDHGFEYIEINQNNIIKGYYNY